MKSLRMRLLGGAVAAAAGVASPQAHAFGDEGHRVVALIAEHFVRPDVRAKVNALLAGDTSGLTANDIASQATWADRYRDSNTLRRQQTREWHFVDLRIGSPDLAAACAGHPPLPPHTPASAGPAAACLVDKIAQFEHELAAPTTSEVERRLALQFLLHLVGDVHQPLHASDDHDHGGNHKLARSAGRPVRSLHHYWDSVFVRALGTDPADVARQLIAGVSARDKRWWARGSAAAWALESFDVSRQHVYRALADPDPQGVYRLDEHYVRNATRLTAKQLSKAGVRLAALLDRALGGVAAAPGP